MTQKVIINFDAGTKTEWENNIINSEKEIYKKKYLKYHHSDDWSTITTTER